MRTTDVRLPARLAAALLATSCLASPAGAQVVFDGTTGPAGALAGPEYQIGAELGRRAGGNLFHSFERFSLATGERATFSGPNGIANVISRVTGGERSDIDGTLRSTVPGADLWFLNPAGVMFGPNARLDVQGSFHVSTADELRFGDGARFSATDPAASTLTVAAPEAFGFLGAGAGRITVSGSSLEISPGRTLELSGGDIDIVAGELGAPAGLLRLSALGHGVVAVSNSTVSTEGPRGGAISIQGHEVVVRDGSLVTASTSDGPGGAILVRGGDLTVESGSFVAATSLGSAPAGRVDIDVAGDVVLRGGSVVGAGKVSTSAGAAGTVAVKAHDVFIEEGFLDASSGSGPAGRITLSAEKGFQVSSDSPAAPVLPGTFGLAPGLLAASTGGGTGGSISVHAGSVQVDGRGLIDASAYGDGAGSAGQIRVASEKFRLTSGALIRSESVNGSDLGAVEIRADDIRIEAASILSFTLESGPASDILIRGQAADAAGRFHLSAAGALGSITFGSGRAGGIELHADHAVIDEGGVIDSRVSTDATGDANAVSVKAKELRIANRGHVSSTTLGKGRAGDVVVEATRLHIDGGVDVNDSRPTTVSAGTQPSSEGDAGTVNVTADEIVISNLASIESSTQGKGHAGSVVIRGNVVHLLSGGQVQSLSTVPFIDGNLFNATLGNAGDVSVQASREIIIDGKIDPHAEGGPSLPSGVFASASDELTFSNGVIPGGDPKGGDVAIIAPVVRVVGGGEIGSSSFTRGSAGNVEVTATHEFQGDEGVIRTESPLAGGGRINLRVGKLIDLRDSRVTSSVAGDETTTAGDITIDPKFIILDSSSVLAQADEGRGGNIRIEVGTLFRSPDSLISASAGPAGINGTVAISAPDEDVSSGLVALPAAFLDASALLRESCAARRGDSASSFTGIGRGGLPPGPDAPLPGFYALGPDDAATPPAGSSTPSGERPASGAGPADAARLTLAFPCGGPAPGARPRG